MESLYLLIPLSLVLVVLIVGLLGWTIRSGQLDDLEGPAHAILMDDDTGTPAKSPEVDPDQHAKNR